MASLTGGRAGERGRKGVAVPLALVLVVALGLLGAGVLALSQRQATTAEAAVVWTRGSVVARGAVVEVLSALDGDTLPRGRLWSRSTVRTGRVAGTEYGVDVQALDREWSLVRGWARGGLRTPIREAAVLVWSLDPTTRLAARTAVLMHGGVLARAPDAVLEGDALLAEGDGSSATACAPYREALDSLFPGGRLPPSEEDLLPDTVRPLPALGLLGPEDLEERLDGHVGGGLTPVPDRDAGGGCLDGSDNWGSPRDASGPCGDRRVALFVRDDVTLEGGEGQGLLAVRGSLTLRDGAVFAGLVVVRDSLTLEGGARLTGFARSGGAVRLGPGSRLEGRACPALLALRAASSLKGPRPAPGGPWIRPF